MIATAREGRRADLPKTPLLISVTVTFYGGRSGGRDGRLCQGVQLEGGYKPLAATRPRAMPDVHDKRKALAQGGS